jgi:hypothetical protein
MPDVEFRRLVLADINQRSTPADAEWLRSASVCEYWRAALLAIVEDLQRQRDSLDEQLAEDAQRLLPQGGSAAYQMCELLHGQRISKIVRQLGRVQIRLEEATELCRALHPPPRPVALKPPVAPLTHKQQVGQLKQELHQTTQQLQVATARIEGLQQKVKGQLEHIAFLGTHAQQRKARLRRLDQACRMALRAEEQRGNAANLVLLSALRDAVYFEDVDETPDH